MGKWLIFFGIILILIGIAIQSGVRINWLGKLPGDISYVSGNTRIYIPITTSILISIVLSALFYIFRWLTR
ncbi:DUF2905 domain-containing protein [Fulvivirga sedimenti]|uniref:DUF2905 domain-containing protein n=1 Tax=Fulvivirga sedimenti TaxID=2879465 RepID=A0A9X1HU76_9BACT|nr:DUF2905 domain-containing protein [Fulvivirga sedimenti]MCA6078388.1 DUF2905 domain-containing protein [Fulvivirga sedimenti]